MNQYILSFARYTSFGALCLLILLLPACGGYVEEEAKEEVKEVERSPLVIPVEALSPTLGDISTYFETSTRVEAERRVEVSSKGTARCIEILAEEGDSVKQGDILAELDQAEAKALFDQTSVQVRQYKTSYDVSKRQFDEGLGTKVDMDNAQYAHEQSLATLKSQKLQLANLTIRAPINGVITARSIQEGGLVSIGETVFNIMDPDSFMLPIAPPEKEMSRLSLGQEAEVRIDAFPGQVYKAKIRRINPSVNPLTGTIKVVLDFEDALHGKLRESAFARVKLVMNTQTNALLIPKEVIVEENGKKYAFVLKREGDETVALKSMPASPPATGASTVNAEEESLDDEPSKVTEEHVPVYRATRVEILTALEDSTQVQVLTGLSEQDLMVTNGQHSLKDGALVRITNFQSELMRTQGMSTESLLDAAQKSRKDEDDEQGTDQKSVEIDL